MKVIFFSKGDRDVVSSRYRCFQFADALRREGMKVEICLPPPRRFGPRAPLRALREMVRLARRLAAIGSEDIAYLQRPIQSTGFVWLVVVWRLLFRRTVVFDYCDPIFMHSPRKTRLLARHSTMVVASCEDLAEWAREFHDNVQVVPNSLSLDDGRLAPVARAGGPCLVVGWAGSARDHGENLRLLLPVLERLSTPFVFRIIGTRGAGSLVAEFEEHGVPIEAIEWVEATRAPVELASFDVALLPVRDTPWNRKLLTKLIDYMGAGVPIVASPVGENRFAIQDGENGFLATSEDDWVTKIELLLNDGDLRRRMGERGRETVRERYSLDRSGARLAQLLRGLRPPRAREAIE